MPTPWTRAELTIVVAALHESGWTWIRATSAKAIELSELLRNPSIYPEGPTDPRFRSPSSIQRKGENLRTARVGYVGEKTRGSALDGVVIAAFDSDPEGVLREAAAAKAVFSGWSTHGLPLPEDDELTMEGQTAMRQHLTRERSRGLRASKIASIQKDGRPLQCEVCSFDFAATYGARGMGYIEVHHIRPLHDSGPVQTSLGDLALVCANCHRMIHRPPWVTPTILRMNLNLDKN